MGGDTPVDCITCGAEPVESWSDRTECQKQRSAQGKMPAILDAENHGEWKHDRWLRMQETRCAVQTQGWAVGSWEHSVPNSPCIQMSGNHSKSECQHHSGSPISYHPMNAILCLSALCEQYSTSLLSWNCSPTPAPQDDLPGTSFEASGGTESTACTRRRVKRNLAKFAKA